MAEKEKQEDFRVDIGDDKRPFTPPRSTSAPAAPVAAGPLAAILSYCVSSLLMTLANKYVLSGIDFNLNFMLLAIQVRNFESTH
jgi:GDP-mannose transporter